VQSESEFKQGRIVGLLKESLSYCNNLAHTENAALSVEPADRRVCTQRQAGTVPGNVITR
jgi:hypothetical protein